MGKLRQSFFAEIYESWLGKVQEEKISKILLEVEKNYELRGKIIDVGSGYGLLEREILKRKISSVTLFSVDINKKYLKKNTALAILASGMALPFKSNTFDFAFCIDTMHILKSAEEIARVLKPRGKAVLSIFCSEQNFEERKDFLSDITSKAELKEKESFVVKTAKEWDFVIIAEKL